MSKIGFRAALYVCLKLFPISVVVANSLTPGTDRNKASQRTDICQGSPQFTNEPLAFGFGVLPLGNISKQQRDPLAKGVHVKRKPFSEWSVIGLAETGRALLHYLTQQLPNGDIQSGELIPYRRPKQLPGVPVQHAFGDAIHERKSEIGIKRLKAVRNALDQVQNLVASLCGISSFLLRSESLRMQLARQQTDSAAFYRKECYERFILERATVGLGVHAHEEQQPNEGGQYGRDQSNSPSADPRSDHHCKPEQEKGSTVVEYRDQQEPQAGYRRYGDHSEQQIPGQIAAFRKDEEPIRTHLLSPRNGTTRPQLVRRSLRMLDAWAGVKSVSERAASFHSEMDGGCRLGSNAPENTLEPRVVRG